MTVESMDIEVRQLHDHVAVQMVLLDDDYAGLRFVFECAVLPHAHGIKVTGFRVSPAATGQTFDDSPDLKAGLIRDLPLAGWLAITHGMARNMVREPFIWRACQEAFAEGADFAAFSLQRAPGSAVLQMESWPDVLPADNPEDWHRRAVEIVQEQYPELDPNSGKAAARRWNGLVRYAETVIEHRVNLLKGVGDSVKEIAERREVSPATVRSWLHRAKEAGVNGRSFTN
ncbi:sigma-70 region 4 domain-containing protein [Streptomyces prunicolor]|uniref:Sigma-70 region 4 domain-containing protein n=1 Tax=Streptomyces prunicolor TaxID=67348 RepID=A0ABU4FK65_9ACTN|nr:sigma-70 region 4 domain-containing protein [Streptomyces prunicolor]MDV7221005.1 sigma-70 region 4 domain-containing protein [Streptomyces prunicolor]